jgi:hypothetical protein
LFSYWKHTEAFELSTDHVLVDAFVKKILISYFERIQVQNCVLGLFASFQDGLEASILGATASYPVVVIVR